MRALIHEMAKDERVIFTQKHPRRFADVEYRLNSFPVRKIRGTMVAKLAQEGYLTFSKRGYYLLTHKAQLEASMVEARK